MEYVVKYSGKESVTFLMWMGLLIYSVGHQIFLCFGEAFSLKLLYAIGVLFTVIPLLAYIKVENIFKVNVIYTLLLLWCIVMYLRSGTDNYFSLYSYGAISYIAIILPSLFIVPFIKSAIHIGRFVSIFFISTFWIPLILPLDTGFIQSILESYAVFAGLFFLTNKYHNKKDIYISFIALVIALLVATITARRNLMLTFGLYIMFGSLFLVFNGKLKSLEIKIVSVLASFLLLFAVYYFYTNERHGTFSKITSRASENTREEVFGAFVLDMFNPTDMAIGRGMYGTYYNPGIEVDYQTGETNENRGNIECGYLQWILKGGLIYLVLYVSLFVKAIIRGFKSKNQFSKGCAIILIIQLIDMFPFGLHDFNAKTFIIWIAVAFCLNKNFTKMYDEEIKLLFYKEKNILLSWQRK